jgi:STAS domain
VTGFVVNLAGIGHMDSTGLSVLVGIQRRLPARGWMRIIGARPNVLRVFELTGLDRAFEISSTLEDALAEAPSLGDAARRPALSSDGALVVGLASTALPFADSPLAEAERWLRVLRLHGEAGRVLTSLGLGETPLVELPGPVAGDGAREHRDTIASVTECASCIAGQRGSATVGTVDLLLGVMAVYGDHFDRVLHAHGSDRADVIERLGSGAR